jgi:flagellar protein FliO/FliZ
MKRPGYCPLISFFFLLSQPVWAQQAAALPGSNSFYSLLQVFFALAVVLGVIGLFAWVLRRMSQGQHFGGGLLKIRGGVMLGPKERVVLLEVADTWIVVGVGGGQVNALHSMPRPAGSDATPPDSPPAGTFHSWLQRAMQGKAASGTPKP